MSSKRQTKCSNKPQSIVLHPYTQQLNPIKSSKLPSSFRKTIICTIWTLTKTTPSISTRNVQTKAKREIFPSILPRKILYKGHSKKIKSKKRNFIAIYINTKTGKTVQNLKT